MTNSQIVGRVVLCAALMTVGACEDATTDPGGLAGTYELVQANGEPLPTVVFDGETQFGHIRATAVSGTLTLRSTTFTERVVFDVELEGSDLGESPAVVNGSYTVDGPLLDFDADGTLDFTGTVSGGVLTTVEVDPVYGETEYVWQR